MAKWNASRTHLAGCSAQLLTGSNSCTSSWETIERLLIILLVSVLPLPSLEDQSGSSRPAPLLFHSKQIWNHHYCVSMMHTRKSRWRLSLRAGDLWRILTYKLEILFGKATKDGEVLHTIPPSPTGSRKKKHSMLTAEGDDRRVNRNSSHFKKFHQDHADPESIDINSSADPVSVDTSSSASAQAELPLRRSAGVIMFSLRTFENI